MIILIIVVSIFLVTHIILIANLSRGLSKVSNFKPTNSSPEYISVIISAHNESDNLSDLLFALARQDYPENLWEIIIVNDRSTDETAEILNKHAESDKRIKIIHISETPAEFAPKKYAIDRAIAVATGSIILLTDADGRPGPTWISTMSAYFSGDTGMVIGYAPYSTQSANHMLVLRLLALEYMSHACIAAATTGLGFPLTCVGTNLAYKKSVYTELGGFGRYKDYHSGDDDLFMQRVRDESNWKISYAHASAAHVYNAPPLSWNQFFNQRLRYASKGFFYPFHITASLTSYYLFNLLLLVLFALGVFLPSMFLFFFLIFLIKFIDEYILLHKFATLTDQKNLLKYYLPTSFLHIPYIVFFGFLGSVLKYKWAGREQ